VGVGGCGRTDAGLDSDRPCDVRGAGNVAFSG